MKKKLLTVLLLSVMVLAGNTVVKAEDMLETNTEDVISNTENPNVEDVVDNAIALYSDNIAISEDIFPDEKFRQYLKDNFDKDGDGYFSQDEIDSITSIEVNSNGMINSLAGINYFKNLKSLACNWTWSLTSLDVSGNPNLQTLECENSNFTTLDVSKNLSLQILKCGGGKLATLNTGQNPNLQTLVCSGSQLTALDVSGNPNLRTLECERNQLTALDVSGNSSLQILKCGDGKLETLNTSQNPNLQTLVCSGNQLTALDVSGNPNLHILECERNQLTALDVSKNPSLQILKCENGKLTTLNTGQNQNLQTLVCSGNQLTALDVSGNPNLTNLQCMSNHLTNLDVSKNSELIILWCDVNQLTNLDVSKNLKLETLICDNNQLKDLNISKNSELVVLECSDNQLSNLETQNPKLQLLWCVRNQLSSLDVSKNTDLVSLRCYKNHLENLDLSYNKKLVKRNYDDEYPDPRSTSIGGAHVIPQNITADIVSTNGTWTLNLATIVGQENLGRVTLATDGAMLSADGTVTFSGSNMPTELVYNYDTKNPAEDTPMTVHVALTQKNVDDQTGKDVTVDTGGLDIDNICKDNNINISANFEIILSQDTPSKESLDKLTQAAGANGYSITATYEILMSLFSNGQKIADITDNFGRIKLTFQVNASLAGQNAVVYQLHDNSQVIVHDGLTVNTDGTVTVTVDKFSAFAVAVKPSSNNTGKPDTGQSGTNKPDSNRPGTNQPDTNKPDTNQPDSNKTDTNQPNINQPDAGQPNVKQTNANQISPKTGDGVNPVFWIIVAMAASITGILSIKICYFLKLSSKSIDFMAHLRI